MSEPEGRSPISSERGVAVAEVPDWLRALVRLLDSAFVIPGTDFRVGLDPLLGLFFPGAGDVAGGLASLLMFVVAFRNGVPAVVMLRMLINVGTDSLVGAVPILGDLFDAAYRSNEKNLELLERYAQPGRKPTAGDYAVVGVVLAVLVTLVLLPIALVALLVRFLVSSG